MATEWAGAYMGDDGLSSLDWSSLEKIAGVTFTEPQRKTLLDALNRYLAGFFFQQQAPRIKALKAHLAKIETHARALRSLLADSSTMAQTVLFRILPSDVADPAAFIWVIGELGFKATAAKKELSGTPGRPENTSIAALIRAWLAVYREAGGGTVCYWDHYKKKYIGRFLDLLEVAFSQANAQLSSPTVKRPAVIPVTRGGLAQAIEASIPPSRQQTR